MNQNNNASGGLGLGSGAANALKPETLRQWNATGECRASLCGKAIVIGGRRFEPNRDSAYVEFYMAYAFPTVITDHTALHPQVVANSFHTLEGKVFNFGHLMRSYDPEQTPRDRILGTIMACELTRQPGPNGWTVEGDPVGIRVVAVMHKAAEGVGAILEHWEEGTTPFTDKPWTVSMENRHQMSSCGFLVATRSGVESFAETTPAELAALGYTYVPLMEAPAAVADCLNTPEDDEAEGVGGTRICRKYLDVETVLLIGGLDGVIEFKGVGLTPRGKEPTARVAEMLASEKLSPFENAFVALENFAQKISEILSPKEPTP